jgi:archaellum component FlaF (FlaF/FlaG flagellin family)
MGLSLSAATAIIGVSVLLSIEFMVANVIPTMTDTNDSFDEMKDRAVEQMQTDITITNITNNSLGPPYDLNITVENTGSIVLETSYFNVLLNGTSQEFTCSETYLYPENIVYFNITNQPNNGRLKIITDNGISDYFDYVIS